MPQKNLPDLAGFVQLVDDAIRQGRQEPNRLQTCVQECRQFGVELLPLDINRSGRVCTVEDGCSIRIGFSLLAPEYGTFLDDLLSEREEKGAFQSFQDFCERIDCAKMPDDFLPRAIQVGAFDALEPSRARLFYGQQIVLQAIQKAAQERAAGQFDLFATLMSAAAKTTAGLITLPPVEAWAEAELIAQEKAAVGFSLLEFMSATEATDEMQDLPDEETTPELIEPSPSVADAPTPLTPALEMGSSEPVSSEERASGIPDAPMAEPEQREESEETADKLAGGEGLVPVKTEEPHDIALILKLPPDTPHSALLQLRDLLKQHPGPSRVILELLDRYAQTMWVRTHPNYAVQMTPDLLQAVEALLGTHTTRQESVRARLLA